MIPQKNEINFEGACIMFQDEFNAVCNAGKAKVNLLKNNPLGYFVASIVAGIFIAFGGIVMCTAGGALSGLQIAKLVAAMVFAVALSLVVMAGACLLYTSASPCSGDRKSDYSTESGKHFLSKAGKPPSKLYDYGIRQRRRSALYDQLSLKIDVNIR